MFKLIYYSQIYSEFEGSMHSNAIPQKDPIHMPKVKGSVSDNYKAS